jgi:hypothetical protein
MWIMFVILFGVILPSVFCVRSIEILQQRTVERSPAKTVSIVLTSILSVILIGFLLAFLWAVFIE